MRDASIFIHSYACNLPPSESDIDYIDIAFGAVNTDVTDIGVQSSRIEADYMQGSIELDEPDSPKGSSFEIENTFLAEPLPLTEVRGECYDTSDKELLGGFRLSNMTEEAGTWKSVFLPGPVPPSGDASVVSSSHGLLTGCTETGREDKSQEIPRNALPNSRYSFRLPDFFGGVRGLSPFNYNAAECRAAEYMIGGEDAVFRRPKKEISVDEDDKRDDYDHNY